MLQIRNVKVRGFRGFTGQREFVFDQPCTILYGGNHCGKSSTLNAIEWCLYGDDVAGGKSNIPERVSWKTNNVHMEGVDVWVELELVDGKDVYVVRRSRNKPKARIVEQLDLTLSDETCLQDEAAQEKLAQLTTQSCRDFMTTTYLHQENVRAILTEQRIVSWNDPDEEFQNMLPFVKEDD